MAERAVYFDLDGTLADTAPDLGAALNAQRARHGLAPLDLAVIRPHASHGTRGLLWVGFGLTPEQPGFAAMRAEYLAIYEEHLCVATCLFPGVPELLDALEARGVAWGVVTNKPARFTDPLLERLGLTGRAGCAVSGDTCARAKPHPDSLLHAAALAGLSPADCVYVGDAERDVQAALAAGMRAVVARYGYIAVTERPQDWGAHADIDAPMELLAVMDGWFGMTGAR